MQASSLISYFTNMAGDILDRFNPKVAKLVELLFTTENIGLRGEKVQIKEQKTGYVGFDHGSFQTLRQSFNRRLTCILIE